MTGRKKGKVILYALSTCVWCRKTKRILNELGIDYSYVDVDLLEQTEREEVRRDMLRWNPRGSFPTLVIDDKRSISSYDEERIRKEFGNGDKE